MACTCCVNMVQAGFAQVPPQLHRRLHVHVVPQEAACGVGNSVLIVWQARHHQPAQFPGLARRITCYPH